MFDDLIETIVPGGFYLALGVTIGAAFGKQLRPLAKAAIKRGLVAAERIQEVSAEAVERAQDLVAEARYEHDTGTPQPAPTTRSSRRDGTHSTRRVAAAEE